MFVRLMDVNQKDVHYVNPAKVICVDVGRGCLHHGNVEDCAFVLCEGKPWLHVEGVAQYIVGSLERAYEGHTLRLLERGIRLALMRREGR